MRVGSKSPVGGNTYVMLEGDPRVFTVATWRVNALSKSLIDLRDRRVLDFEAGQVETLRAGWPGGEVALERGDDGWHLKEPVDARASDERVEGLLSTLQFLRASGFVDEPMNDEDAGLLQPHFDVELGIEGADAPLRMTLGKSVDGARRLVRGEATGVLYEVEETRLSGLPRSVGDYRFKTLSRFDVADAVRFELEFSSGETVSGKLADPGWETAPVVMAAGRAARLIEELSALEALDIAAEEMGADELAGFGLSPAAVTIRVFGEADAEGDAPLAAIRLGGASPDKGIPAQRVGEEAVYWLSFERAEHLPVSYEAFENRFLTEEEPDAPADPSAESGSDDDIP